MDVLTVVKERLFLLDDVILSPILPEFYGWPPICSPASALNLFLLIKVSFANAVIGWQIVGSTTT